MMFLKLKRAFYSKIGTEIKLSVLLKVINVTCQLVLARILLDSLGEKSYGLFATILTINIVFGSLDLGIGNGIRNMVASSLDSSKYQLRLGYFNSGVLTLLLLVCVITALVYYFDMVFSINHFFNLEGTEFNSYLISTIIAVGISFVFKSGISVYQSIGKSYMGELALFIYNLALILFVAGLDFRSILTIDLLVLVNCILFPSVYFFFFILCLIKNKNVIKLDLRYVNFKSIRELIDLSYGFFVVSLSSLLIYGSINFVLLKFIGPEAVTVYFANTKILTGLLLLHYAIINPLWSKVSRSRSDINSIRRVSRAMKRYLAIATFLIISVSLFSPFIQKIWLGDLELFRLDITVLVTCYTILYAWSNGHSFILNGLSLVKVQRNYMAVLALLYPFLVTKLISAFGLGGFVAALIIITIPGFIINIGYLERQLLKSRI